MNNEEKFVARIELNSQEAHNRIRSLQEEVTRLKKQQQQVLQSGTKESKKRAVELQREIDVQNKLLQQEQRHVKGLSMALQDLSQKSYKDLQTEVRSLQRLLRDGSIKRNGQEWKDLAERIKQCKKEMREFEIVGQHQASYWSRFTKFLNDSWGGLAMLASSIAGISMTIRKTVADYAAMEQEMANVRKYTGQTDEEVKQMNEDFKKMDTRTSREELNRLAGAAGRLGIKGNEMVEEFVDGADKIRVALGDDLGDSAVDVIGKLAIAFGEDKEKGLRGAMLATGSALNELVQNSPAQAQPIIEFTSKLSGVGQQAHMTQAQIMGFAAALDQNNQEMATSSTVMSQLITKMYQDPARFAKMAGLEVQKFAELVKTDMNQALIEWLQHVNKLGDMSVLAGKFDELKMDGTRAVGVLATLAGHIDQVTEAQRIATDAYKEGNSVIEEFNIQNGTVQAQTEKAKKRFHDLAIELGEKLLPVVKYTISGTSLLVKGLLTLINFIVQHKTAIIATTSAIIALNAKRLYGISIAKLEVLWNQRLIGTFGSLFKVIRANPWGLAITAVTTFIALLVEAVSRQKALKEEITTLGRVRQKASEEYDKERVHIELLNSQVHNNKIAYEKRKEALEELKKIVPGYLGELDEEKGLLNDNTEALTDYMTQLEKSIKIRAAQEELEEAYRNKRKLERQQSGLEKDLSEANTSLAAAQYAAGLSANSLGTSGMRNLYKGTDLATKNAQDRVRDVKKQLKDVHEQLEKTENDVTDLNNEISTTSAELSVLRKGDGGSAEETPQNVIVTSEDEEGKKERKRILKERVQEARAEYEAELAEEMLAYRQGITTYSDYMKERHNITQNYYDEMKRIYGEDAAEYRKLLQRRESDESEFLQWQRKQGEDELIREKLEKEMALRRSFYDEQNKEAYQNQDVLNEALFQLEIEYQQKRKTLYNEGSKEWMEQDALIRQKELQHQWDLEQDWMKRLAQYREEMGRTDIQKRQQMEEEGVKAVYGTLVEQGRMTEEEYDAIIEHIRMKYAQLKAETSASQSVKAKAGKSLETAEKAAGTSAPYAGNDAATGVSSVMAAVERQRLINERLKELYGEDYENNAEYQEAKRQLDSQTMQSIVAGAEAAYSTISTMLSAASSFAQACSDLEVARITRNYDRQIEAAGKNSKKREKLEKEKEEAIAKAKTKANKKAMVMELAQALAQTAMGAISAYSSTMAGAPYPANLILAPISAGIATAAGMLQVATIKKQHQAEAAGYYEGGFTSGKNYRREAGVVHEGEFVANHQAVNNAQLSPIFNLIDRAQRNNRVAQLKAEDVSRVIGSPAAAVVTPVVNVQTDNSELQSVMSETRDTVDRLNEQLEKGIRARVSIDGEDGVKRNLDQYNNMMSKK